MCPAPPLQLTQRRQHERAAWKGRPRRRPVYPASARTRGGTAAPVLWLPVIGDWTVGGRTRDVIGCNPQSLNEPGRGGATSGRDTTTRLFQGRQAPSLACFVLFTRVCSLLLTKLRVHDYKFNATNRSHTFGGGRLLIPVGLGYGSFRYH